MAAMQRGKTTHLLLHPRVYAGKMMRATVNIWRRSLHMIMILTMSFSKVCHIIEGCQWIVCSIRLYAPCEPQSARRGAALSEFYCTPLEGCLRIMCSIRLYAPRKRQSGRRGTALSTSKVRECIAVGVSVTQFSIKPKSSHSLKLGCLSCTFVATFLSLSLERTTGLHFNFCTCPEGCRWITCSIRLYAPCKPQSGRRGAAPSDFTPFSPFSSKSKAPSIYWSKPKRKTFPPSYPFSINFRSQAIRNDRLGLGAELPPNSPPGPGVKRGAQTRPRGWFPRVLNRDSVRFRVRVWRSTNKVVHTQGGAW